MRRQALTSTPAAHTELIAGGQVGGKSHKPEKEVPRTIWDSSEQE